MIRRDTILADGTPGWSLIAQRDHARLSGELAAAWGNQQVAPVIGPTSDPSPPSLLAIRAQVLAAIAHHDDGWRDWDEALIVDPENARPYSFMDMPLSESLDIWRQSIMGCERIGPLAAWMVAGHFIDLRSGSHTHTPQSQAWIAEMETRRAGWLSDWQAANPEWHTLQTAEAALQWLRWFDALSLWLCLDREEPIALPLDDSMARIPTAPVQFRRNERAERHGAAQVRVHPWPFEQASVEFSVRSVNARLVEQTKAVPEGREVMLQWRFKRVGDW